MNRQEFMKRLNGNLYYFTRTCLATGHVSENETLIPCDPIDLERTSSIRLGCIHCYGDSDLFTEDFGVLVAVVKTDAGHIFCDRFVAITERRNDG